MAEEVVLLDFWPSPFGMRSRIALAEKGIKYEYKEEDLRKKSALLLQMNPVHKNIRVLIHNGKPLYSGLIMLTRRYMTWRAEYGRQREKSKQQQKKEVIETLKLLEKELGDKPYFGGESLGYVDVAFIPFYSWFYAYEKRGNFSIEAECPKLIAWAKRCMQKESVAKSLPDQQKVYDFILQMKKHFGIE
ncbi:hypothetical protein J1N35_044968 [Gossypium stocksii]|uniref:glutathione transferase n=1 Tax=Gossypium stocksii TaxID=47602 RepID=A0A9D3ZG45_9ROSI|nr:hypothetical protein J1N35_044968 [Gossypium stocksii]